MRAAYLSLTGALLAAAALVPLAQQSPARDLARALANARGELVGLTAPEAGAFTNGDREIAAGDTVTGPVAVIGTLRVAGTIIGDAFAYAGDVLVLDGGRITGSAVAFDGRVLPNGGSIDGDARTIGGAGADVVPAATERSTRDIVALTLGWSAIALIVGIGVLVFGGRTLDAVALAVQENFGRSLVTGIGTTLAIAPALVLLVTALVLTILGILLVPLAIVAFVLAITGLVALGFLAAARATGQALARRTDLSERGAALRALVAGLAFYFAFWLLAAFLHSAPTAASVVRVVAFAATWAAATVGLGAAVLTRAGTQAVSRAALVGPRAAALPASGATPATAPPPPAEWQTPTPATGVVAARRPTSAKR